MPYIFVRSSMNENGLFSNQTFIDFEDVAYENGEPLSAFLSRELEFQLAVINPKSNGLETAPPLPKGQNQSQTLLVSNRAPHLVLNKLEHLGYKVVAANSQRPGSTSSTSVAANSQNPGSTSSTSVAANSQNPGSTASTFVAYNVWTLHKPLG